MSLTMPESLYLIASDDQSGARTSDEGFKYAMAVAILNELLLQEKLLLNEDQVVVQSNSSTSDPLLNLCLRKIATMTSTKTYQYWVDTLKSLYNDSNMLSQLISAGDLEQEEASFLYFFTTKRFLLRPQVVSLREFKN